MKSRWILLLASATVGMVLLGGCRREAPPAVPPPPTPPPPTTTVPPPPPKPTLSATLPARPGVVQPSRAMPPDYKASTDVEFYGNFETAGVLAQPGATVPTNRMGKIKCFLNIDGAWAPMQDLVQIGATPWYATSLFWLKPNSSYQVKVVFQGKNTNDVLATYYGQGNTRKEPTVPETLLKLYVSPSGDDANAGSIDKPLRTVAKAFTMAEPGLTMFLRAGVYYEGDLELARSGEAGGPIVIRAYPGEKVVMDGSDPDLLDASVWKDEGGGVYSHAFEGPSFNMVLEDKQSGERIRLLPLHTVAEVKSATVNEYGKFADLGVKGAYACDGTTAYVRPPQPLSRYTVHIGKATKCARFDRRRHLVIDGLEIRYYGKGEGAGGLMAYDSADVLIQNCSFAFVDTPIWIKKTSDRITVQDCTFVDGLREWPFGLLKMGGAFAGYETGAVYVDSMYSGRGLVVRRNHISDLFDGVHLTSWTVDDARSNETDFYQNFVYNCVDDFMELDGFSRNVRIFDNYMRRALTGISLAQALDGPTYCIYNVIGDCGVVPATTREGNFGYPFKTNGGPGEEIGSGPIFFYHNTSFTVDPQSRAAVVKYPKWRKITFRNNIWYGRQLGFEIWRDPPSPMDLDWDNIYVADTNAPLFQFAYHNNLNTIDEVRRKRFWMKNGISADPLIADEAEGIYELTDASPCIDAGTPVPGINFLRAAGKAPDQGAYEKQ